MKKTISPTELEKTLKNSQKLNITFFRQKASGSEPVRDWLRQLPENEKKAIGEDIKACSGPLSQDSFRPNLRG
jgi:hypothetical protein